MEALRPVLVDDLELPQAFKERLKEVGLRLTVHLALANPNCVAVRLGLSVEEAEKLVEEAAEKLGFKRVWPSRVKVEVEKVTTCSRNLDSLLNGGVEVGEVTELYGAYASGKTQLCHQLCVSVQLPKSRGGLGAKAAYVDVDGSFRPERAKEMAEALGLNPEGALRKIAVFRPSSVEEQVAAVEEVKRMAGRVRLLALDTVIGLFRVDYGEDVVARQWRLLLHLKQLRELAELGVAVVVANQVVAGLRGEELPAGGVVMDSGLTKLS